MASTSGGSDRARPDRARLIAAFAAVYLIWGSTYLAIRFAIETLPPFLMAGTRFLIAGAALYAWRRARGAAPPEPVHWKTAAISSFFMLLLGAGGLTWAEQFVPSGLAALIIATVPLWLALLGWAAPDGVRPGLRDAAGIGMGLVGVGILMSPGDALTGGGAVDPVGGAVLLGGSVAWAFGSLYHKAAPAPGSHLLGVAQLMAAGGVWLLLAAVASGELAEVSVPSVSLRSLLSLLYLIAFGSIVAFSAYVWLLKVAPPAQVGTYAFVNPVVAVGLGWLFASEPITPRILVAAAVIVVGVAMIVWKPRRRARRKDPGPGVPA